MTVLLQDEQALLKERRQAPATSLGGAEEGAAFFGEGAAANPATLAGSSIASLSARHILRDGEIILLILKPSRWYVVLSSFRFVAGVLIVLGVLQLSHTPQAHMRYFVDGGLFALSCRVMWAVLSWMGRLYVLTDQRILRFAGVFNIDVFDCPLRKVASTRMVRAVPDRLLQLGTIEIQPADEARPASAWQLVSRPVEVHEQIVAAIRKAKQGGCGGANGHQP